MRRPPSVATKGRRARAGEVPLEVAAATEVGTCWDPIQNLMQGKKRGEGGHTLGSFYDYELRRNETERCGVDLSFTTK